MKKVSRREAITGVVAGAPKMAALIRVGFSAPRYAAEAAQAATA